MSKTIIYEVSHPGERASGVSSYEDTVLVMVDSGDPGGEPNEFEMYMKACLAEWFDGARVEQNFGGLNEQT